MHIRRLGIGAAPQSDDRRFSLGSLRQRSVLNLAEEGLARVFKNFPNAEALSRFGYRVSRSIKGHPSAFASNWPTVDFPLP